jgi:hypothetical protein
MSFKSQAQKRKFSELVQQGKMKQSTFDEFNNSTGNKQLPERLTPDRRPKTIEELRAIAKRKLKK